MRRNTTIGRVKALSTEKKILLVTSSITLVACFMPWYGINSRVINEWWNAFGSIGSVAGYLLLSFSIITILGILLPVMKPGLDFMNKFSFKESSIYLFCNIQSFFIAVIFIPVYSQYALINATNSGTRFGIYMALLSTLAGAIASLSYYRRLDSGQYTKGFASIPRKQRSFQEWENSDTIIEEDKEMNVKQELIFGEKDYIQSNESDINSGKEASGDSFAASETQDRIFE